MSNLTINLMILRLLLEMGRTRLLGIHAPLYTNPADPKLVSADSTVKLNLAAEVRERGRWCWACLFMGVAWGQVEWPTNHGLFQPEQWNDGEGGLQEHYGYADSGGVCSVLGQQGVGSLFV